MYYVCATVKSGSTFKGVLNLYTKIFIKIMNSQAKMNSLLQPGMYINT